MLEIFKKYQLIIFDWEGTLAYSGIGLDHLYPETIFALQTISEQKIHMAIATGKNKSALIKTLAHYKITDYFSLVCSSSEFAFKPDPEMLNHTISQLKIDKKLALMVGDSSVDILAAKAAGIDSMLIIRAEQELSCEPTYKCHKILG